MTVFGRLVRSIVAIALSVGLLAAPGQAWAKGGKGPGEPEGGQNACTSIARVEENLGCANLLIDIASLYLDSIATLPAGEILPELPDYVHPEAKRWINRNRFYQPPSNDGYESFLNGVRAEPSCDFPDRRWVVEGTLESGVASATFTAICDGVSEGDSDARPRSVHHRGRHDQRGRGDIPADRLIFGVMVCQEDPPPPDRSRGNR